MHYLIKVKFWDRTEYVPLLADLRWAHFVFTFVYDLMTTWTNAITNERRTSRRRESCPVAIEVETAKDQLKTIGGES